MANACFRIDSPLFPRLERAFQKQTPVSPDLPPLRPGKNIEYNTAKFERAMNLNLNINFIATFADPIPSNIIHININTVCDLPETPKQ